MMKIPLDLQKERQNRHNKLMSMINSYQLTKEEKAKLQKIKSHTMMEINLRFLRSQVNRNYKYPKTNKSIKVSKEDDTINLLSESQDEEQDKKLREQLQEQLQENGKKKKRTAQSFVYDLRAQNFQKEKEIKQIIVNKSSFNQNKFSPLEQGRRVHSLGNQRSQQKEKDDFIIRRHLPLRHTNQRYAKSPVLNQQKSSKSLKTIKLISQTRKPSKQYLILEESIQKSPHSHLKKPQKNLLVQSRRLKLPEISSSTSIKNSRSLKKLAPIQQKLKTQKLYEEEDIQMAIGKKLATETSDSGKKAMRGVEKYLKDLQTQKFYNNQGNPNQKFFKKQSQIDKFKGNMITKTTKNSLKGEIDKQLD